MSRTAAHAQLRMAGSTVADVAHAARETGVVWAGMVALGVGFGILTTGHGFPWWLAPVISFTMFAGSVEFLLVGMLAVSAPVASIALTTFLINSRHLFYGISFPLHRIRGRLARCYSVFALSDEAYALLTARDDHDLTSARMLWTQAGLHLSWVLGSLVGGLVGASFLSDLAGLDFLLTALFVVLALDAYQARPDRVALGLALAAAVLALVIAPGSMLLVAMASYTGTLIARSRLHARGKGNRGRTNHA